MIEKEKGIEHTNLLIYLGEINCFLFWNGVLHTTVNKGHAEKTRFGHGRTSDWCYRNFLKTMNYLNMVLYNNERFPLISLMQVKRFSLFQSKFSLWLAKDSWLISCEIIMSDLMKPTEKFVPIYMLVKNKKMFQRAVLVFP